MAEETVLIRFKGEDDASGTAKSVQQNIDGISTAAGNAGGAFSSMGSIMTGVLQGVGQNLATFALDIGGKALGAVTDFIGGAIDEAAGWQSAFAQTEAVIKSTGGAAGLTASQMADMAVAMSAASGQSLFSDDAILGAQNVLATFTQIKGENFGTATQSILDMSQALGTDLNSAAMQVGKALNDPVAGLAALSRSGVQFTADQEAMIKAMVESGNVAGAQKVMLDELANQFGGSASAAVNTFAGQQIVLQEKIADVQQTLGEALLPVLVEVGTWVADTLVPILADGVTALSAWITSWTDLDEVLGFMNHTWSALVAGYDAIVAAGPAVGASFTALVAWLQPLTDAFTQWGATVIPIVTAAGQAIAEYIGSPTVQGYISAITTMVGAFATMLRDVFVVALQGSMIAWNFLVDAFTVAWPSIKVVLDSLFSLATIVATFLTGAFTAISQLLKGDFSGAWKTMSTTVETALNSMWGWVQTLQTNLKTFFTTIKDDALALGSNIAQGIADGIASGASWVAAAITKAVQDAWAAATGWLTGQSTGGGGGGGGGDDQNGVQGRSTVYNLNFSASYSTTQSESSLINDARAMMTTMGAGL